MKLLKVYFLVLFIRSLAPDEHIQVQQVDIEPLPYKTWESCNNDLKNLNNFDPTGKLRLNSNNVFTCIEKEVQVPTFGLKFKD